jgi:hypothetical protein
MANLMSAFCHTQVPPPSPNALGQSFEQPIALKGPANLIGRLVATIHRL